MSSIITDIILPMGIIIFACWWWLRSRNCKEYLKNIPGPPTYPLLGNALDLKSTTEILDTFLKYIKDYGGLVKIQIGPRHKFLLIADYNVLEYILSSSKLLTKSDDYRYAKPWLGTGLLTSEGAKWKKHRRMLSPAFHYKILEQFLAVFESCGKTLLQKLEEEVEKDSVDIYPFITLCTLDIICESTMGITINAQNDATSEYVRSVHEICKIVMERLTSPIQMHDFLFLFTKNYSLQKKVLHVLHEKADSVILQRYKELQDKPKETVQDDGKKKKAFLDLLLEAEVDGRPLSHEEIRQEVATFLFAGHDTTASAISFTLYCLANHPDIQQIAFEEQQAVFKGNGRANVTYSDLQNMKYLEEVIKESLRLYPPVPVFSRKATEDIQYENTVIPKGCTLFMFPYGIHRDPKYFADPEIFNPRRFENFDGKFPYAYIPFSAGPRNCIGQKFAMLKMKHVISKILRKFELQPATPRHTLKLVSEATLRSATGIMVRLKFRN